MNINNNNSHPAPNLLRGIVSLVVLTVATILSITWLIINHQVEQLVSQRTSEYAHSIARVAADSSAESLLADDVLQLNLLVENVAKDPHIRQATIYSENGLIVSQYPANSQVIPKKQAMLKAQQQVAGELEANEPMSDRQSSTQLELSKQFVARQQNIPFIEPIVYQDITAGWFKIEVDSQLLGQKFRDAYFEIQLFTALITLVIFLLMLMFLFRMEKSIHKVAESCHHLLIQNKIKPPSKKSAWIKALNELSQQQPQQLSEHTILPNPSVQWQQSSRIENALIAVLEFEISYQEKALTASNLTLAEQYLNQATQAYGVQSQGDLLTGCMVPFTRPSNTQSQSVSSALSFLALIKSLLERFDGQLKLKGCLLKAPILLLEDDQELITGLALLDGYHEFVKVCLQANPSGTICSLFIPFEEIAPYASAEELDQTNVTQSSQLQQASFRITELTPELEQQITRKRQYISQTS
jgi:uncharacterized membrane protein affecting hemolysin expression